MFTLFYFNVTFYNPDSSFIFIKSSSSVSVESILWIDRCGQGIVRFYPCKFLTVHSEGTVLYQISRLKRARAFERFLEVYVARLCSFSFRNVKPYIVIDIRVFAADRYIMNVIDQVLTWFKVSFILCQLHFWVSINIYVRSVFFKPISPWMIVLNNIRFRLIWLYIFFQYYLSLFLVSVS